MHHGEQVQLLLSAPGHAPMTLPHSPWRGWIWTEQGPVDPVTAAHATRVSPVSPRAERALVAAVQADDLDSLIRLAGTGGPAQEAASVLCALRLASLDPAGAIDLLVRIVGAPSDPTANKLLHKHWSALAVQVALAPSVPALFGVGRTALGLLLAELLADVGRTAESLAVLDGLLPSPPVVLARAAALLALGEHHQVLALTTTMPNVDDVAALALVARSVAARTEGDLETALSAVCGALAVAERSPAVIAAALEERAHLYTMSGDAVAARADLEALSEMTTGRLDVPIPAPSTLKRHDDEDEEQSLDRARDRIRRRITGVGAPGTFGGRHHSTYRDEIATMFAHGQIAAVEELLLGLLDAVEDEVDELRVPLDATFFLTLADLYQDNGRSEDLIALRERYAAADARARRYAAEGAAATGGPSLEKRPVAPTAAAPAGAAAPVTPAAAPQGTAPAPVATHATGGEVPIAPTPTIEEERLADVLGGPAPDDLRDLVAPSAVHAGPAPVAEDVVAASPTPATPTPAGDAGGEGDPVVLVEPAPEPAPAPPEPRPERELTPVERAVRGPRVRSL